MPRSHILQFNYAILAIIGCVFLFFLWSKWDFVSKALSDKDGASSVRLCGFIFTVVVAFNELYITLRTQKFDTTHLLYMLISIGVFFGYIKMAELFSIWKGSSKPNQSEAK